MDILDSSLVAELCAGIFSSGTRLFSLVALSPWRTRVLSQSLPSPSSPPAFAHFAVVSSLGSGGGGGGRSE